VQVKVFRFGGKRSGGIGKQINVKIEGVRTGPNRSNPKEGDDKERDSISAGAGS